MDFRDVLDAHRIPYHEGDGKSRKGWINFKCPFCEKDPYMGFNVAYAYVTCWNCGRHSLLSTLLVLTGKDQRYVFSLMKGLPRERKQHERKHGVYKEPEGVELLGLYHKDYLCQRGFNWSHIAWTWGVRGIGQLTASRHMRWRLFIPIFLDQEKVSWTTRTVVKDKEPRYLTASPEESAVHPADLLYGIDYCSHMSVVVVEGPLDAWAVGPGCVALLGLTMTPARLQQLSAFSRRTIVFDNEPVAQARARKLCDNLAVFPGVTANVTLDTGKDAAAADRGEIESLRQEYLT